MTMLDVYHSGKFHIAGSTDGLSVVDRVRGRWAAELEVGGDQSGPSHPAARVDLWVNPVARAAVSEFVRFVGEIPTAELAFHTQRPWDEESRLVWGPMSGAVVDELLGDAGVDGFLLTSDEGYCVGYWRRDAGVGVINSVGRREGYSMRAEFSYMLLDRFESAGIGVEFADLGDLPGGVSTEFEG